MQKRNNTKIRVMWLSINASLFDVEKTSGGWTSSLEYALKENHSEDMELAVVFERKEDDNLGFSVTVKDEATYYQISNRHSVPHKGFKQPGAFAKWKHIRPQIMSAIEDFKPNVIQCFGSEWPYGMIAESVEIPVIIHMQGFLHAYGLASRMLPGEAKLKSVIKRIIPKMIIENLRSGDNTEMEQKIMSVNRYFMGRTEWDKSLVKHFSPGSKYYIVPEAIRPEFLDSLATWKGHYNNGEKAKFLTASQASSLKGNDVILYTARILKNQVGLDFEWRIAGDREYFMNRAKQVGIDPEDVNIRLLGFIPVDQIIEEMTKADMFIHPSIIDNSPNAICEAQIIGCPVIASRVGGVPDLIEDGVTGFLYPYNEPYTLAFKIADLLQDPQTLMAISEQESVMACQRHDPKTIADTVYRTYLDVIQDYKSSQRREG